MKQNKGFLKSVCALAIPVALQSMLQASFSIVDQIMIGSLGSVQLAGVGIAGKFSSIYTVVVSAFGAVGLLYLVLGGVCAVWYLLVCVQEEELDAPPESFG